eukprot:TRINITY_DN4141_c0_g1_i3.p2 TRINITY_DN4141_c0_g1~~TRINITY_DN4141_c0_g1_i3.p2  ORF type:complete len:117 (-),score=19.34 TRINITY_DN4141_c0_g1_i3:325-675(-)
MSDVEKFNEDIEELNKGLDRLDEHLKLIYKFKNLDELSDQISISDYAKLNTSLAYALNSLYYVYMKANAIPFEDHKINSEIVSILPFTLFQTSPSWSLLLFNRRESRTISREFRKL